MTATIAIFLLMASLPLMAQAQTSGDTGGQKPGSPGGGIRLPAGVTPDVAPPTYAYLSIRPQTIGVGQIGLFNIWISPSIYPANYMTDYTVTLTKPDNTTDTVTLNSYYADATAWFEYTFDQVGTWKAVFYSPGQYFPKGNYTVPGAAAGSSIMYGYITYNFTSSRYYAPCTSPVTEIYVQNDPVRSWPPAPLPQDYWVRPVPFELREWWPILGNYPWNGEDSAWASRWPADTSFTKGNTKYNAWVVAPNSAHIVWRRQDTCVSGMVGADAYQSSTRTTGSTPGVIYAGRCYQTMTLLMANGTWQSCAVCYDLRTGQQYYAVPTTSGGVTPTMLAYSLSLVGSGSVSEESAATQQYTVDLMAFQGNNLVKINPNTGLVTLTIAGFGSGTLVGNNIITIQTNNTATGPRLINWTTAGTAPFIFTQTLPVGDPAYWNTGPSTTRVNANYSVDFTSIGSNVDWDNMVFGSISAVSDPTYFFTPSGKINVVCYSIKTGHLTCNVTVPGYLYTSSQTIVDHGKIACLMENGFVDCYNMFTGAKEWSSESNFDMGGYPWGVFGAYSSASYAGNLILDEYSAIYAWNWETGKLAWAYNDTSVPFETPYQDLNPWDAGVSIADGKIYSYNTEHSQSEPTARGWKLHCFNATTGKGIWNITGPMVPGAIADGYLTAGSQDGYMYVFGRGQSATTATASPKAIAKGDTVMIEGTVMDKSPGVSTSARSTLGAACVSDASQRTYMEYLYMQEPIDGMWHNDTVTGVPVTLIAVSDCNGTVYNLGTVTSDVSGTFHFAWTPPANADESGYTIRAIFAGSESYGSSWAESAVSVGPAPAPIEFPPTTQPTDYTMTIIGGVIAIIVVVVIAVAAAVLILRKRQ